MLKAGEGDEEAGTYVTDDGSTGSVSVSLVKFCASQIWRTSSYCKRSSSVAPQTADTCSSSVKRKKKPKDLYLSFCRDLNGACSRWSEHKCWGVGKVWRSLQRTERCPGQWIEPHRKGNMVECGYLLPVVCTNIKMQPRHKQMNRLCMRCSHKLLEPFTFHAWLSWHKDSLINLRPIPQNDKLSVGCHSFANVLNVWNILSVLCWSCCDINYILQSS